MSTTAESRMNTETSTERYDTGTGGQSIGARTARVDEEQMIFERGCYQTMKQGVL